MGWQSFRGFRMYEVSIVMCAYRRAELLRKTLESIAKQNFPGLEIVVCEDGDDGGWTRGVCEEFGAQYFQRKRAADCPYSNPSAPWNVAIREARGEILILQNPECLHASPDVIERLVAPHRTDHKLAVFASVMALNQDGSPYMWYCHPEHSPRPFFFCGSLRREVAHELRGFDEDFPFYGFDDNDFAFRLQSSGVRFDFRPENEILVHHLWHPTTGCYGLEVNEQLFSQKMRDYMDGKIGLARNLERAWGAPE